MKKVKVGVYVDLFKEVELEVPDNHNNGDLLEAFESQVGYPQDSYNYLTDNPDNWLIVNSDMIQIYD